VDSQHFLVNIFNRISEILSKDTMTEKRRQLAWGGRWRSGSGVYSVSRECDKLYVVQAGRSVEIGVNEHTFTSVNRRNRLWGNLGSIYVVASCTAARASWPICPVSGSGSKTEIGRHPNNMNREVGFFRDSQPLPK
jgi:hypothetical protein